MAQTQQCLLDSKATKAHEALLKADPTAETFYSKNDLTDEKIGNIVKLHKTALKNPNNTKEDRARIHKQIYDLERARYIERTYRKEPEDKSFHVSKLQNSYMSLNDMPYRK